jgi:(p)ppGpp synthase/HD superfamily hydrolase
MSFSPRFAEALTFAAALHAEQRRKLSGAPYIAHLLAVTATVLEHGADEDTAIAALLHDAIEDQGGPAARAEILRRFGPAVTAIVDGCTDADTQPVSLRQACMNRFEAFGIVGCQHATTRRTAHECQPETRSSCRTGRGTTAV